MTLPAKSMISQLDPYMDIKETLPLSGILKRSSLSVEESHPFILSKKCRISNTIIQWSHQSVAHGAREQH